MECVVSHDKPSCTEVCPAEEASTRNSERFKTKETLLAR